MLARFVSADSIIPGQSDTLGTPNPQNLNRYSYVNNNPVRYNDPSGHCIFALVDTIVCAAVAAEVVEVVVTAVVGAAVIATAYEAGGAIGRAQAPQEQAVVPVADSAETNEPESDVEPKPDVEPPAGTNVTNTPSKRAAQRAADRAAGIGKHGQRTPEKQVPLRPGSQSPQGDPGTRTEYENPENGAVVHHDPYGNYYPETDEGIGPHYGVEHPDGSEEHFTYPSKHDPRTNR